MNTATNTINTTDHAGEAKSIALLIAQAQSPQQKSAATRRLNQYLTKRTEEGAKRNQVHAGIKSLVTKINKGVI